MEERSKFVLEKQRDELNMAELCRRYGIPEMEYDSCYYIRRVNWQGRFLWNGERVALSPVLAKEWIGLKDVNSDREIPKSPVENSPPPKPKS